MILLRPDCLVFETSDGEHIPCSAYEIAVQLLGQSAQSVDAEMMQHAAAAVLHYFKSEKGQTSVCMTEFSDALERVLRGLGFDTTASGPSSQPMTTGQASPALRVIETDLSALAGEVAQGCELLFFPRLRDAVRGENHAAPTLLRFRGLRACVKQLTGARRWGPSCQALNDQIVEYLRQCLHAEDRGDRRALVVW